MAVDDRHVRHRALPRRQGAPRARSPRSTPPPRTRALLAIADALEARTDEILEANARDLEAGREAGLAAALIDRLALDDGRVAAMAARRARRSSRCPTRSAR